MKKKLTAFLVTALMLVACTTSVFASTSPSATVTANAKVIGTVTAVDANGNAVSVTKTDATDAQITAGKTEAAKTSTYTVLGTVDISAAAGSTVTVAVEGVAVGDTIKALHQKTDGTFETIDCTVKEAGKVTFTASSFSPFTFVKVAASTSTTSSSSTSTTTTSTSPSTGSSVPVMPIVVLLVAGAGVALVSKKAMA